MVNKNHRFDAGRDYIVSTLYCQNWGCSGVEVQARRKVAVSKLPEAGRFEGMLPPTLSARVKVGVFYLCYDDM